MNNSVDKIVKGIGSIIEDVAKASLPALDVISPGLGMGLSCALNYYERQGQKNLEMFIKQLDERLKDLALETEEIRVRFDKQAHFIVEIVERVKCEKTEEKIAFYVGAAVEVIQKDVSDQGLQREFVNIIAGLSEMELIWLEALEQRGKRENLTIPRRGESFLRHDLIADDTNLAWFDSLIRKGLVVDVSIENIQSGYTTTPCKVLSRSAIRLSDLARSMIEYMKRVQHN